MLLMYCRKKADCHFAMKKPDDIIDSFRAEKGAAKEDVHYPMEAELSQQSAIQSVDDSNFNNLNNSYRMYPWYVLFRGGMVTLNTISKKLSELQLEDKSSDEASIPVLNYILLNINTSFYFNTEMSMKTVRSVLLYQRALRRMSTKDYKNASIDCNEALNYNPALRECYLLKARIDHLKGDNYKVRVVVPFDP